MDKESFNNLPRLASTINNWIDTQDSPEAYKKGGTFISILITVGYTSTLSFPETHTEPLAFHLNMSERLFESTHACKEALSVEEPQAVQAYDLILKFENVEKLKN